VTLEEKIVSYADKLIETSKRVPVEDTVNKLREKNLVAAAERVRKLHDEITNMTGDKQ
jgi:tRNA (cytidine56-2'-O)-methyltransferase